MTENEKSRILIVDDENANIAALCEILREKYVVSVAKTGQAALKLADEDKPDLILLDILMPDMTGLEVLAKLQDMDKNIPVIFIADLSSADDEEKGLRAGAVDYITKPFCNGIVKARVGTHIKIVNQIRTIERLGMIDALTDIPNRRFFDMRIDEEWRRTCRRETYLSILMIDVDKFKIYNDTYGHPQGDLMLKFVAKTLATNLRRPSDMVARIGGEEFAVLLADTDINGALIVGENLRTKIRDGIVPCAGKPTSVTVSIGVNSLVPTMDLQIRAFIEQADKNLYTAKATGRNRVVS
jgi:diguanylate cyclase (GGDEF)-like protein